MMPMDRADQIRKKYLPALSEHLACCTAIYQRMTHLMPQSYALGEEFHWHLGEFAKLTAVVQEQHKYMDLLSIEFEWTVKSMWLTNVGVHLRLYHDMRIAEVAGFLANEQVINLLKRDNSNIKLRYPTEKNQIHHLLFEWLTTISLTG